MKNITVIVAGIMGNGIAVFAQNGFEIALPILMAMPW
jgi:3-hydroxyacyl-CoA dehydrogenase